MNESRSSYIKFFPLVFLGSLLIAGLHLYRNYYFLLKNADEQGMALEMLFSVIRNMVLWGTIGLAFKKWKPAAAGFVVAVALAAIDLFVTKSRGAVFMGSAALSSLYFILVNATLLPALTFGLLCFNRSAVRYLLPMWLLTAALSMAHVGSGYLDMSPYNTWYRMLQIDHTFKVYTSVNSYTILNLLSYLYTPAAICITYIMIGECFTGAASRKRLKDLFRVDLRTGYTRAGAGCLFLALRLAINLLVVGLYTFPLAHFFESGRIYIRGQSLLNLCLVMVAGLAGLIAVTLYYRRFLVEYFISIGKKISWLFWIVNIPVIGMLVFPFVALFSGTNNRTEEERALFYFNDALYYQKPYKILTAMLVMSLLTMWLSQSMRMGGSDMAWLVWLVDLALLIWYALSITGYYVVLGTAVLTMLLFWSKLLIEKQGYNPRELNFGYGDSPFYKFSISLWLITAFSIVQYAILLPVFHLRAIKTVQEPIENMQ